MDILDVRCKLQSMGLPWRLHLPVAMGLAACLPVGLFLALYQPFAGQVHSQTRYYPPAAKQEPIKIDMTPVSDPHKELMRAAGWTVRPLTGAGFGH